MKTLFIQLTLLLFSIVAFADEPSNMYIHHTSADGSDSLEIVAISSIDSVTYYTPSDVAFEGPALVDWDNNKFIKLPLSYFENISAGTTLKIRFTQHAAWGQFKIVDGNWGALSFSELGGKSTVTTDNFVLPGGAKDKQAKEINLILTQEILTAITDNTQYGDGLILSGKDWTIDYVRVIQ